MNIMNITNKISKISATLIVLLLFLSCNKFLDKQPLTQFTDNNYWTSEAEVQLFCNGFYSEFNGFGTGAASTRSSNLGTGAESDFYFNCLSDDQDQTMTSGINVFLTTAPGTANTWNTPYNFIRLANLLLARIDKVPNLSDAAKNHYRGIAYFFRAMEYYDLVRHYGDVPYTNKYLDQNEDSSIIWGPRIARNIVMDSVLSDLNHAIANLYSKNVADATSGLGTNTVNQDVANALKSRICLFEGTYAKYVEGNTQRATQYLQACQTASEAIINSGTYKLYPDYRTVYSSLSLSTNGGECMLYRIYDMESSVHVYHQVINYCNSSTLINGLTKDAVDAFLCTDGLPISLSPLYQGDNPVNIGTSSAPIYSITNTTLKNRDKRLAETIDTALGYVGNPFGQLASSTGYIITRFNNPGVYNTTNNDTWAPIFWLPEILLNEAEATAELGNFTQAVADNTINLLRARAGVASLEVNNIPNDPNKDADVSSLIWEIRRERRVELMLWIGRYWDLRRWNKVFYLDPKVKPNIFVGAKVPLGTFVNPDGTPAGGGQDANGYIQVYAPATAALRVVSLPQVSLDPIPTGQLQLYQSKNITFPQNPGW